MMEKERAKNRVKEWRSKNKDLYKEKRRIEYKKFIDNLKQNPEEHKKYLEEAKTRRMNYTNIEKEKIKIQIYNRQRKQYFRNKEIVLKLLGGKCKKCGCNNNSALEIHHINGGGSKEVKGENERHVKICLVNEIASGRRGINDLILLCGLCHKSEHLKKKGVTGWKIIWEESLQYC